MAVTWDVLRYDTVDSTNNVCKTLAAQGLDSTAVIARAQTAGKGRLGRSFNHRRAACISPSCGGTAWLSSCSP